MTEDIFANAWGPLTVYCFDFGQRAATIARHLRAAGIRRVRDLLERTPIQVRAIPGVGPVLSDDIYRALQRHGLALKRKE